MGIRYLLIIFLSATFGLGGCRQSDPVGSTTPSLAGTALPSDIPQIKNGGVIAVPESVKGKWGAVRLVLEDKTTGAMTEYAVPLRSRFTVPETGLTLEIGDFLPDFTIQDSVFTSVSDRPDNPAVKVTVFDGGKSVFDAWLFSMYPSVHPFTHPRYGLSLKEGVPAT